METRHRCGSVQSKNPPQTTFDQTLLTGKPNLYVPKHTERRREEDERKKAREEEEPQSVEHNLITPICHAYIWTHTAAELLVEMMQKQSRREDFSCRL